MAIWCDVISDVSLGTSTAKTQLSGDRSGNATNYILPASARGILYVEPVLSQITPTSTQTTIATLKVESDDLGVKDYEVLAPPIGGAVATNDTVDADLMRGAIYPFFQPCRGGETMQLFGVPQIANTAAPNLGAQIWLTDNPAALTDSPYRARVGGTAGGAGSITSSGTATGNVTGATITLGGGGLRTIRSVTGIAALTTNSVSKPFTGWFGISAPELAYTIRYGAEPVQGLIGTGTGIAHLTRVDNLSIPLNTPSSLSTFMQITAVPSTAGSFAQGILYN